jgi:wyosine [tRNA(Phe)-imidazoG37] synthetase (radical SAM superfamily)
MAGVDNSMLAFGPVPSRRLGQSLGINNIPPKACSYSCVYCQVGVTSKQEIDRREFYSSQLIYDVVNERLELLRQHQQHVDYLTFVPDGEPTLDIKLATTIEKLRVLGFPVAIITNASLIWQAEVREVLSMADFVSLKIDSTDETTWRHINRPHPQLGLSEILQGIEQFAREFPGTLVTETMLIDAVNDTDESIDGVAEFVQGIKPYRAYIAIPIRPPAEPEVNPASQSVIVKAHEKFKRRAINTELLTTEKQGDFGITGNIEMDLVNIASVHPLSEQAVQTLLEKKGAELTLLDKLLDEKKLVVVQFDGKVFYMPPRRSNKLQPEKTG